MSLSLIGIIFVQSYWINASVENKEEEFNLNVKQILSSVSNKIQKQEKQNYFFKLQKLVDSLGQLPDQVAMSEMFLLQKDDKTNETFLFRSGVVEENYSLSSEFFETNEDENISLSRYYGKSSTTFFDKFGVDNRAKVSLQEEIERVNQLPEYNHAIGKNLP